MCALFLDAVLGFHRKLGRHLVAVVAFEVSIEQFVVAGDTSSDTCGVGGENRPHFRALVLQEEHAESRHPLMGLVDDLATCEAVLAQCRGKTSCSVGKHGSFVVVAVSMQRINTKQFPSATVDLIFLREERLEINQNGYWISGNLPPADAHRHTFFKSGLFPLGI